MEIQNPRTNPYVGPRAYETGETLYGREREVRDLLLFLISQRIVLLHSPSGAGKTSLVQAGLIPRLREEGFLVLPVVRVNLEPPDTLQSAPVESSDPSRSAGQAPAEDLQESQEGKLGKGFNRYIYSVLLSLEEGVPAEQQVAVDQLAELTLAEYLDKRPRPQVKPGDEERPQVEVLIFDQFEEILTVASTDHAGRAAFFTQVGDALRQRHRWALFSMREDYIAALDPYLRSIPTRLTSHYRLDLLGVDAALQAIRNPPQSQGVEFSEDAAKKMVDDLRRVQIQQPDGSIDEQPGPYVEPVQLQVVCYRLWQNLDPADTLISEEDVAQIGDVNQSLRGYYAERVVAIAEETGVPERKLREWFERKLITETGIRSQVLMGQGQSEGLDNRAIRMLEDAHLVRAEKRRGVTWFELAHDRLIRPVHQDNSDWFQANLSLLQRQADAWQKEDRPEGMLLRDQSLLDAEAWSASHANELTEVDQDFLEESRKARAQAERERQEHAQKLELAQKLAETERTRAQEQEGSARRLRRILVVMLVMLVAAVVLGILVFNLRNQNALIQADSLRQQATAQALKLDSLDQQATAQAAEAEVQVANAETAKQRAEAEQLKSEAEKQKEIAALNQSQARVALANQFALNSLEAQRLFPQRSLLSAIEGIFVTKNVGEKDSPVAYQALINALSNSGGTVLTGHSDGVLYAVISPDDHWLATSSRDDTARLWDLTAVDPAADPILLAGHTEPIDALAISPDSRWLATGSRDNTTRLWDLNSANPTQSSIMLGEQGADIASLAFTPDGLRLVTGSTDGTARIWNMASPDPAADPIILAGGQEQVFSVAISPDGRWLATGSLDGAARVWDLRSLDPAAEPLILNCHDLSVIEEPNVDPRILTVAFSKDGRWLASGSQDAMTCLWDLSAPNPEESPRLMNGHLNAVRSVAFSPDGHWLASGSLDRTARLWNLEQEDPTINSQVLRGHQGGILTLAFSPNNRWLATGSTDFTTRVWDLIDPDPAATPLVLYGHEATIRSIALSSDGRWLATASMDNTARLWDLAKQAVSALPIHLPGTASTVPALDYSPDGRWLATGSLDGSTHIWDLSGTEPISSTLLSQGKQIKSLEFSPDGHWLAAGGFDGVVNLWEIRTNDPITNPTRLLLDDRILTLAFNPDGNRLAVGGLNDLIRLWDISIPVSPESYIDLTGYQGDITALQFSPDGLWLAGGSQGGDVRLWDMRSSQPIGDSVPLVPHAKQVDALAFSPDNHWMATGGSDGTIHIYDLTQNDPVASIIQLEGYEDNELEGAISLDFSPDSRWLASGSADRTARLFDMTRSDPAINPIFLRAHLRSILSVDFSPDGHWLATGGDEGTVLLWDMTSPNPAGNPRRLPGKNKILEVIFSPDSKTLATANQDGVTRLWLPTTQDLIDLACDITGRNMTLAEWQQVLPDLLYRKTCPQWPEGR